MRNFFFYSKRDGKKNYRSIPIIFAQKNMEHSSANEGADLKHNNTVHLLSTIMSSVEDAFTNFPENELISDTKIFKQICDELSLNPTLKFKISYDEDISLESLVELAVHHMLTLKVTQKSGRTADPISEKFGCEAKSTVESKVKKKCKISSTPSNQTNNSTNHQPNAVSVLSEYYADQFLNFDLATKQ